MANKTRLIVSFIGDADLAHYDLAQRRLRPREGDREKSPLLRLLQHLKDQGLCDSNDTEILLFDDRPEDESRKTFCAKFEADFPQFGLGDVQLNRHELELPKGPTDYEALKEAVWKAIPAGDDAFEETIFHVSSGTSSMHATLLLAANCMTIKGYRLFETSREHGALELRPPYVVAMREATRSYTRHHRLPNEAHRTLLPHTVIEDAQAASAYAILHRAAMRRRGAGVSALGVLIEGSEGSGKWHAARQFAKWRGGEETQWTKPFETEVGNQAATLLIWRLHGWSEDALQKLAAWRLEHPNVTVAATWRTGCVELCASFDETLLSWERIFLPPLEARADILALAEALAKERALPTGKLKERLQVELFQDYFPGGLPDLQNRLVTAATRSPGLHPDRNAYDEAGEIARAQEAGLFLHAAFDVLSGGKFGGERPTIEELCKQIEIATICLAKPGRTDKKVGELIGRGQSTVTEKRAQGALLNKWRAILEGFGSGR